MCVAMLISMYKDEYIYIYIYTYLFVCVCIHAYACARTHKFVWCT